MAILPIFLLVLINMMIREYLLCIENICTLYQKNYDLCEIYLTLVERISANWK